MRLSVFVLPSSALFQPIEESPYSASFTATHKVSLSEKRDLHPRTLFCLVETATIIFRPATLVGSFKQ